MGILTCSRNNCGSIMCDTYVGGIGCICFECQGDFKNYVRKSKLFLDEDEEVYMTLKDFMEHEKGLDMDYRTEEVIEEYFEKRTAL